MKSANPLQPIAPTIWNPDASITELIHLETRKEEYKDVKFSKKLKMRTKISGARWSMVCEKEKKISRERIESDEEIAYLPPNDVLVWPEVLRS